MTRRPKLPLPIENLAPSAADANATVQVKVWSLDISPMAGLFNALFFGGMGRVSLKCHTPTQTAL